MQGDFLPAERVRAAPFGRFVERSRSGARRGLRFPGQWFLQEEETPRRAGAAPHEELSGHNETAAATKGADAPNWMGRVPTDC